MADTMITPLQNEYNSDGKRNPHGIKSVLKAWEEAIRPYDTNNVERNGLDYLGLPKDERFSRQYDRKGSTYYGYPDVWDLSEVTDLTWRDENGEVKGLFEGKNLQKLFIRPATQFVEYFDKEKINNQLGKPKNNDLPSNWQELLYTDVTSTNDGPVVNISDPLWEYSESKEKHILTRRRLPRVFFIHMWDLSNVRNATRLFKNCIFNMEICNWNFDNLECMDEMFMGTKFFCTPIKFIRDYRFGNMVDDAKKEAISQLQENIGDYIKQDWIEIINKQTTVNDVNSELANAKTTAAVAAPARRGDNNMEKEIFNKHNLSEKDKETYENILNQITRAPINKGEEYNEKIHKILDEDFKNKLDKNLNKDTHNYLKEIFKEEFKQDVDKAIKEISNKDLNEVLNKDLNEVLNKDLNEDDDGFFNKELYDTLEEKIEERLEQKIKEEVKKNNYDILKKNNRAAGYYAGQFLANEISDDFENNSFEITLLAGGTILGAGSDGLTKFLNKGGKRFFKGRAKRLSRSLVKLGNFNPGGKSSKISGRTLLKDNIKSMAAGAAVWAAWEIAENVGLIKHNQYEGAPPPPGNPFDVEDVTEIGNLPNMSPSDAANTSLCNLGALVLGFVIPFIGSVMVDLACYTWDYLEYAEINEYYKYNPGANTELYSSGYFIQAPKTGTSENYTYKDGDYMIIRYWNFQATTLFSNNVTKNNSNEQHNPLKNNTFLPVSKFRMDKFYDKNGIAKWDGDNDKKDTYTGSGQDIIFTNTDLDRRVEAGLMRKKGHRYIWLNNIQRMNNGGGQYEKGKVIYNWEPATSDYLYLPTNITRSIYSWSIRKKDEERPWYTKVIRRFDYPGYGDNNRNNRIKDAVESIKGTYNEFSMNSLFQNALTDVPLFSKDPSELSKLPISTPNDPKLKSQYKNITRLYDYTQKIGEIDEFKWDLSEFKSANYAFADIRRLFEYGFGYKIWLDIGSSPAEVTDHLYSRERVEILKTKPLQYKFPVFKNRKYMFNNDPSNGTIISVNREIIGNLAGKYITNSLYPYPNIISDIWRVPQERINIYKTIDEITFNEDWLEDIYISQYPIDYGNLDIIGLTKKDVKYPHIDFDIFNGTYTYTIYDMTKINNIGYKGTKITKYFADYDYNYEYSGFSRSQSRLFGMCSFKKLDKNKYKAIFTGLNEDGTIPGYNKNKMFEFLFDTFWEIVVKKGLERNGGTYDKDKKIFSGGTFKSNRTLCIHSLDDALGANKSSVNRLFYYYHPTYKGIGSLAGVLREDYGITAETKGNPGNTVTRVHGLSFQDQVICYRLIFEYSITHEGGFNSNRRMWGEYWCFKAAHLALLEFDKKWKFVTSKWFNPHKLIFPNLYSFIGHSFKLENIGTNKEITRKELLEQSQKNKNQRLNSEQINSLIDSYSDVSITNILNQNNFKSMESMQYMFRGCSFEFGFEDFWKVLFSWNELWIDDDKNYQHNDGVKGRGEKDLSYDTWVTEKEKEKDIRTTVNDRNNTKVDYEEWINDLSYQDYEEWKENNTSSDDNSYDAWITEKEKDIINGEDNTLKEAVIAKNKYENWLNNLRYEDYENWFKENNKTRDLSYMFSDTDFLDYTNNSMQSLNVRHLNVNSLFGNLREADKILNSNDNRELYKKNIPNNWQIFSLDFVNRYEENNYFTIYAKYLSFFDYSQEKNEEIRPDLYEILNIKYAYFDYYNKEGKIPEYSQGTRNSNQEILHFKITEDLLYVLVSKYLTSKYSQKKMEYTIKDKNGNVIIYNAWDNWGHYKVGPGQINSGLSYWYNSALTKDDIYNPTWLNPSRMLVNNNHLKYLLDNLNTYNINYISNLFKGLENFDIDISKWDFSGIYWSWGDTYKDALKGTQVKDLKTLKIIVDKFIFLNDLVFTDKGGSKSNALVHIGFPDLDTSLITDMSSLFEHNRDTSIGEKLNSENFNTNILKWNVSNVTNMKNMFKGCKKFNQDISKWDVSKVTIQNDKGEKVIKYINMENMFNGCEQFDQDLSNWDVSNVTNMENMFNGCEQFNQDLSNWDVSKVKNASYIFENINYDFNLNWNIPIYDYDSLKYCIGILYNEDQEYNTQYVDNNKKNIVSVHGNIQNWDVSNVKNMSELFKNLSEFNEDISKWNVSNVESMRNMFYNCIKFNGDISEWDTENVTDMSYMFYNCKNFNQNINTKYVIDTEKDIWVQGDSWSLIKSIKKIKKPLSWNTENVTNMSNMLNGAEIFNQDVRNWDVSKEKKETKETKFENIFSNTNMDDKYFKYMTNRKITNENKYYFFKYIVEKNENEPKIKDIIGKTKYGPIQYWNTRLVTNMDGLFQDKTDFNEDISEWDVSNVISMKNMFNGAINFNQDIRLWDVRKVTSITNIFTNTNMDDKYFKYVTSKELNINNKYEFFKYPIEKPQYDENSESNIDPLHEILDDYFLNPGNSKYGPIENWNVSYVTDMQRAFRIGTDPMNEFNEYDVKYDNKKDNKEDINKIYKNKQKFNKDISEWDVSNVTNMKEMFYGCSKFNQDISIWDVENVTNMERMFAYAGDFGIDIRNWNVRNANIYWMFRGNRELRSQIIRNKNKYFLDATTFNEITNEKKYYYFKYNIKDKNELMNLVDEYLQLSEN